jgi:glycosyltransferase 2 family protein
VAEPQRIAALTETLPAFDEPPAERHVRSPSDVLRLLVGFVVLLVGLALATGGSSTVTGFDRDILRLFGDMPDIVERLLIAFAQSIAALFPIVVGIVVLVRRRFRLFAMLVLAWGVAQVVLYLLGTILVARIAPGLAEPVSHPTWIVGPAYPDSEYIAGLIAAVTVGSAWAIRGWRRVGWAAVILAALFRIVSGTNLPSDLVLALGTGMVCGSAVLLVFGAPNWRPDIAAIVEAMRRNGVALTSLRRAAVDARSSTPYFGVASDGLPVFIKVRAQEERDADLMFRIYRFLRLKDVCDHRPFTSLQRLAEHEAFVALYAADGAVLTPRLVAATTVGEDGFLLAYERISGESLDRIDDEVLTDAVLRRIWVAVRDMRLARIAHRDLRLANVFLATDGRPWIIDFGFAEIAATDQMLDTDVAELLSSTAVRVGPERAVDAAIAVLGKPAIASAAPRIQPLALGAATRRAMAQQKPLCHELRDYAAEASDAGDVEPVDLQRIKARTLVTFAALAFATYLLVPQLVGIAGEWRTILHAQWIWVAWAIGAAAVGYLAAALSLQGAVPGRIPLFGTVAAQLAGSFLNRITPARVGGIATSVRYLQKRGVDLAAASTAVGLQYVASTIAHVTLSLLFLAWAGRSGSAASSLLPTRWLLIALGVIAVGLGILFGLPQGRKLFRKRALPIMRRSGQGVTGVVRRPLKLLELFGGSAASNFASIAALALCVQAFGGGLSIVTLGVVYLVGTAAASVVPTPGGIGAVEAALITGLTALGMDRDIAVPAVFLYRIVTFWLPILPGWLALTVLQRREAL